MVAWEMEKEKEIAMRSSQGSSAPSCQDAKLLV